MSTSVVSNIIANVGVKYTNEHPLGNIKLQNLFDMPKAVYTFSETKKHVIVAIDTNVLREPVEELLAEALVMLKNSISIILYGTIDAGGIVVELNPMFTTSTVADCTSLTFNVVGDPYKI